MKPRCFPFAIAALMLALGLVACAAAATGRPPNIVIMLVDDMGVMDTSLPFLTDENGVPRKHPLNSYYRTPNMERLAERGVRFNNFNAMSVCSPTRISIMTGQNAARHHTTNWIHAQQNNKGRNGPPDWNWNGLRSSDVTLPALLRTAGYRTIHVGKAHFASDGIDGADPAKLGFDVNIGGGTMGQPGSYFGKQDFSGKNANRSHLAVPGLEKYHGRDIFLTEALTLEAKSELDRAVKDGKPFFLYFAQYAVHSPFESDPRFAGHYKGSGRKPAAQAFATLIEGMDKSLGDVMDHLDQLGVSNNTLIVFLGDNGSDAPIGEAEEVGSSAPLRGKKGSCYEGGVRVPFIAAWAKPDPASATQQRLPIAAGAIQPQLASIMDLFPTVISLAGAKVPEGHITDGVKLDSLFTGKPDSSRRETFLMHYPHEHRSSYWSSLRDGDWKVIHRYFAGAETMGGQSELYNLRQDPFEQKNLAATHPEDLKRMIKLLGAGLASHQALYPVGRDGKTPVGLEIP